MPHRSLMLAAALAAGLALLAPAAVEAQARCYGVEDGYEDNEFRLGSGLSLRYQLPPGYRLLRRY